MTLGEVARPILIQITPRILNIKDNFVRAPTLFPPRGTRPSMMLGDTCLGGGLSHELSPSATDQALRLPAPETDLEWRSPLFPRAKATSTHPAVQVA